MKGDKAILELTTIAARLGYCTMAIMVYAIIFVMYREATEMVGDYYFRTPVEIAFYIIVFCTFVYATYLTIISREVRKKIQQQLHI